MVPKNYYYKDYGGNVEYFTMESVSFITIQAINRGLFDIDLDQGWESDCFQFYMGALANAVPNASQNHASQPIDIEC